MRWYMVHPLYFSDGRCFDLIQTWLQFSRTVAPERTKILALVALIRHFNWTKVVIIRSTDRIWLDTGVAWVQQLQAEKITVTIIEMEPGNFKTQALISEIKASGIRIATVIAYDEDVMAVAESAFNEGTGAGWAWILHDKIEDYMISRYDENNAAEIQGFMYLQPLLPSKGMPAFAEQVSHTVLFGIVLADHRQQLVPR